MTGRLTCILSVVLLCGSVACEAAGAARGKATLEADRRAAAAQRAAAAVEAVDRNTLPAFAAALEPELTGALADLSKVDPATVTSLAAFREFGRYFGRVRDLTPEQRQTLRWLASRPRLLPVLMTGVCDADAPQDVLAVLAALHRDQGDRLEEYADFTAALCLVWDAPPTPASLVDVPPAAQPQLAAGGPATFPSTPPDKPMARRAADPDRAVRLFRFFAERRSPLAADLKALPWQVSMFLVDTPLAEKDIEWALRNYGNRKGGMGRIYFEVPYEDATVFKQGGQEGQAAHAGNGAKTEPDREDALPYTLSNIRSHGGVCLDQAYFAANVTRAVGVPAAICMGYSGTGRGIHAWVGYLQRTGRSAAWNFSEGRYAEALFWTGRVIDPQGGPPLSDAEVALTSELTGTTAENRLAAAALCKSRDLVDDARAADLYMKAIDLSAGHRPAWMGLADLGAAGKLTRPQVERVTQVLNRFAVEKYPDFAFAVYRRIIAGRSVDEQLAAMQSMEGRFSLRPDLVATVRLARGDLLRGAGRRKEALGAYGDAMNDPQRIGPILPAAMDRVDAMLRETTEMPRLVNVYKTVWSRTPPPQPGGYMDLTPFVIIGRRYERILRETGDHTTAATVAQRLARLEGEATRD